MLITKIRKVLGYIVFALVLQYILSGCKETQTSEYCLIVNSEGEVSRVSKDSITEYAKDTSIIWAANEKNDTLFIQKLRWATHEYMLSPTTKSFERGEDYTIFFREHEHPEHKESWKIARFAAKDSTKAIAAASLLDNGLGYETHLFTMDELDNPYSKEIQYFTDILLGLEEVK